MNWGPVPKKLQRSHADSDGIRVNQKWRICFKRTDTGAEGVEPIDYH